MIRFFRHLLLEALYSAYDTSHFTLYKILQYFIWRCGYNCKRIPYVICKFYVSMSSLICKFCPFDKSIAVPCQCICNFLMPIVLFSVCLYFSFFLFLSPYLNLYVSIFLYLSISISLSLSLFLPLYLYNPPYLFFSFLFTFLSLYNSVSPYPCLSLSLLYYYIEKTLLVTKHVFP